MVTRQRGRADRLAVLSARSMRSRMASPRARAGAVEQGAGAPFDTRPLYPPVPDSFDLTGPRPADVDHVLTQVAASSQQVNELRLEREPEPERGLGRQDTLVLQPDKVEVPARSTKEDKSKEIKRDKSKVKIREPSAVATHSVSSIKAAAALHLDPKTSGTLVDGLISKSTAKEIKAAKRKSRSEDPAAMDVDPHSIRQVGQLAQQSARGVSVSKTELQAIADRAERAIMDHEGREAYWQGRATMNVDSCAAAKAVGARVEPDISGTSLSSASGLMGIRPDREAKGDASKSRSREPTAMDVDSGSNAHAASRRLDSVASSTSRNPATVDGVSRRIRLDPGSCNTSRTNTTTVSSLATTPATTIASTSSSSTRSTAALSYPWLADEEPNGNLTFRQDKSGIDNRAYRLWSPERFLWLKLSQDRIRTTSWLVDRLRADVVRRDSDGTERRYRFFGSTDSKLKDSSTVGYFEELPGSTVYDLLHSFGNLQSVLVKSGPGKYIARLSLSFSRTTDAGHLAELAIVSLPDLENADGSKVFSDGCGVICEALAEELARTVLKLDFVPSGEEDSGTSMSNPDGLPCSLSVPSRR